MSKMSHSNVHEQIFTCGAACAHIDSYGRTETSIDKLVAVVKSVFRKR